MKKFLFAVVAVLAFSSVANADAGLRREGVQNFYYYFGAPWPVPCVVPCGTPGGEPCPCPEIKGILD